MTPPEFDKSLKSHSIRQITTEKPRKITTIKYSFFIDNFCGLISFSVCYRDSHTNPYNFLPSESGPPVVHSNLTRMEGDGIKVSLKVKLFMVRIMRMRSQIVPVAMVL